jgi:probable HAF family extracellular repeat protein
MKDLGTLPGDLYSWANDINGSDQAVGTSFCASCDPGRAFIWQNGTMTDLNSLIGPHQRLYLAEAFAINDRGWIAGFGVLPNGDHRAFVLYPCDQNAHVRHAGDGCQTL